MSTRISAPDHEWISAHVFHRGAVYGEASDAVIRDVVGPFVRQCLERGWIDGWFFIRYGWLGPHVRLRMRGAPHTLAARVVPALEAHVPAALPPALAASPSREPEAVTHASAAAAVRWIAYEPEVQRYGGEEGVRAAEALFCASSAAAVELLQGLPPGDRNARLGVALSAFVVLLATLAPDPAESVAVAHLHRDRFGGTSRPGEGARLLASFEEGYAEQAAQAGRMVRAVWNAVEQSMELPGPLERHAAAARALGETLHGLLARGSLRVEGTEVRSWYEARRLLLPSYVHMTANRLGVTPAEEAYLSHMVARVLGAPGPVAGAREG